jgi:hypothetical protein
VALAVGLPAEQKPAGRMEVFAIIQVRFHLTGFLGGSLFTARTQLWWSTER